MGLITAGPNYKVEIYCGSSTAEKHTSTVYSSQFFLSSQFLCANPESCRRQEVGHYCEVDMKLLVPVASGWRQLVQELHISAIVLDKVSQFSRQNDKKKVRENRKNVYILYSQRSDRFLLRKKGRFCGCLGKRQETDETMVDNRAVTPTRVTWYVTWFHLIDRCWPTVRIEHTNLQRPWVRSWSIRVFWKKRHCHVCFINWPISACAYVGTHCRVIPVSYARIPNAYLVALARE